MLFIKLLCKLLFNSLLFLSPLVRLQEQIPKIKWELERLELSKAISPEPIDPVQLAAFCFQ
jgi:hypothetical protein